MSRRHQKSHRISKTAHRETETVMPALAVAGEATLDMLLDRNRQRASQSGARQQQPRPVAAPPSVRRRDATTRATVPPPRPPVPTSHQRIATKRPVVARIVEAMVPGAETPKFVALQLEDILGRKPTAHEAIEAMIAVADEIGQTISGAWTFDREFATEMLLRNASNRSLRPNSLQQMEDDMRAGGWEENGSGVAISRCGLTNDGQHRCEIFVKTNLPQRMNLTVGVTRESRRTIDIGIKRTAGDQLALDGYDRGRQLAAIAKAILSYESANGKTMGSPANVSGPAIQERARDDDRLHDSEDWARRMGGHLGGIIAPSLAGFVHYQTSRANPTLAEPYLEGIFKLTEGGRGIAADDLRWIANRQLRDMTAASNHPTRVEVIFKGWIAWLGEGIAGSARIALDGEMPLVGRSA